MTTKTFMAPAINCGHCTNTIEMEVGDLTGVNNVKADVDSKQVTVEWGDPATWAEIEALLDEIGFPAKE